jgi:hypothetical protein
MEPKLTADDIGRRRAASVPTWPRVADAETANAALYQAHAVGLIRLALPDSDLMTDRTVLPSVYEGRLFFNDLTALGPDGQFVVGPARGSAASRTPAASVLAFPPRPAR